MCWFCFSYQNFVNHSSLWVQKLFWCNHHLLHTRELSLWEVLWGLSLLFWSNPAFFCSNAFQRVFPNTFLHFPSRERIQGISPQKIAVQNDFFSFVQSSSHHNRFRELLERQPKKLGYIGQVHPVFPFFFRPIHPSNLCTRGLYIAAHRRRMKRPTKVQKPDICIIEVSLSNPQSFRECIVPRKYNFSIFSKKKARLSCLSFFSLFLKEKFSLICWVLRILHQLF